MKKATRHETREFLLQALYARSVGGESFDALSFSDSYYDERYEGISETPYFQKMFAGIIEKESELLALITKFAPKFDVSIMPTVNILPIFIAAYEMLYFADEAIPEKVSIDEAIELAKKFSDDGAKALVNGVLNSVKNEKENIIRELDSFVSPPKRIFQ